MVTPQAARSHSTCVQEKALLVLLALLDSGSRRGGSEDGTGTAQPRPAAVLIAEAGGEAIVQRLEDAWQLQAAAAAAAGEEEGEDPSFLHDLVELCRRVRQRVAAVRQQAGGAAGIAGSLGGGRSSAPHDSSEL